MFGRRDRARVTPVTISFFLFFFFFLWFNDMHLFKVQRQHPPAPLHTRRLKSQHHGINTTFPNSTPRHEFTLGGGDIPPLHSPSLRFIPLGFLHSGLMDFVQQKKKLATTGFAVSDPHSPKNKPWHRLPGRAVGARKAPLQHKSLRQARLVSPKDLHRSQLLKVVSLPRAPPQPSRMIHSS